MRIQTLLVCVLLAGCSGDAPDGEAPVESLDGTSGNETVDPAPPPAAANTTDLPPSAELVADVRNGTAPLFVNFTLAGVDPEGGALSWSFDPNGNGTFSHNGTGLPAQVAFEFGTAGNHTALLVVSDGNHTVRSQLLIAVVEALPPPYQYEEGGISGVSLVCHGGPDTDTGEVTLTIDAATWGQPFTLAFRSGAAHDAYAFTDAGGQELAAGSGGLSGGGWSFSGTVPQDAAHLHLYACENTFDETFTYEAGTPP